MNQFTSAETKVAQLLDLLCDPKTPYTSNEVRSRVEVWAGDNAVAVLLPHLHSANPAIVCLALEVLEQIANADLEPHLTAFVECLAHDDRLVRQAAIELVQSLGKDESNLIATLRKAMLSDEVYIATQAAIAIISLASTSADADEARSFLKERLEAGDPMTVSLIEDSFFGQDSVAYQDERSSP